MEKLQLLVLKEETSTLDCSGTLFKISHLLFLGKNCEDSAGWRASWQSKVAAAELLCSYMCTC